MLKRLIQITNKNFRIQSNKSFLKNENTRFNSINTTQVRNNWFGSGKESISEENPNEKTQIKVTSQSKKDQEGEGYTQENNKEIQIDQTAENEQVDTSQKEKLELTIDTLNNEINELKEELEETKKQKTDLLGKLKQSIAEIENTRERLTKENKKNKDYAIKEFAQSMLDIADSLDMAQSYFEKVEDADKQMGEGIQLVMLKLDSIFNKFNIRKIDTTGKQDPNLHEGVAAVPMPDKENMTIIDVQATGYMLKEIVLRAPKVIQVKN